MKAVKETGYCLFSQLHEIRYDQHFVHRIKELLMIKQVIDII
jgi:hypothetical protein